MTEDQKTETLSVRVSTDTAARVRARASAHGQKTSPYIEGLLAGELGRPRPVLAAAGGLLCVCRALMNIADAGRLEINEGVRIREQAKLIIAIIEASGEVE